MQSMLRTKFSKLLNNLINIPWLDGLIVWIKKNYKKINICVCVHHTLCSFLWNLSTQICRLALTFGNWHWLIQAVNQGKSCVCIMYYAWSFVRGRPHFKAGMKQKFWSSCLPNCDLYLSETASWTRKTKTNVGLHVGFYIGPSKIHCHYHLRSPVKDRLQPPPALVYTLSEIRRYPIASGGNNAYW